MKLADIIKNHRKQKGLTQEELAEKLFVTRQAVSSWETGRTRPDLDTMKSISDVLDVDLAEFNYNELGIVKKMIAKNRMLVTISVSVIVISLVILSSLLLTNYYNSDEHYIKKYSMNNEEVIYNRDSMRTSEIRLESDKMADNIVEVIIIDARDIGTIRREEGNLYFVTELHVSLQIGAKVFEDGTIEHMKVSTTVNLPDYKRADISRVLFTHDNIVVLSKFYVSDYTAGSAYFSVDLSDFVYVDENNTIQKR